jgi:Dockerin type I domain
MSARMLFRRLGVLACLTSATAFAQTDPVPGILGQLTSPTLETRENGFFALLGLIAGMLPATSAAQTDIISLETTNLVQAYPSDANNIVVSLVSLLTEETLNVNSNSAFQASITDESFTDYYSALISAVASLNDVRTVPALVAVITTGSYATDSLAGYGPSALGSVVPLVYSSDLVTRESAAITLQKMVSANNFPSVNNPTSLSTIRAALRVVSASFTGNYRFLGSLYQSTLNGLPTVPFGDLNGDGLVNCADIAIIKASFGKKVGQAGFDIRADVNGDGVVNILDLSAEARLMPTGTVCN